MPALPKRPCAHPGCPKLVESGRCPEHQREATEQRGSTSARGYDREHKRLRLLCFDRDGWTCQECGWQPEIIRIFRESGQGFPPLELIRADLRRAYARHERHLHADHVRTVVERPDLQHDLGNLRTLCNVCHSRKTAREDGSFGRFDV